MTPINLIDVHFQRSNLFHHLPVFDEIYYEGHPDGKIQKYKAVREGQECCLLAVTFIRKEEDVLWQAAEDLLDRCVKEATTRMQGIYTFDLLTFDIHKELNTFNFMEFGALISNNARKTPPGEQRLVKYSSAYGLLQKLVVEPWGKVVLKTSVELYKDSPKFIYLWVEKLFKLSGFSLQPLILLLNDLSSDPVFNTEDAQQQNFLMKTIDKQCQSSKDFLPEVYVQDKRGVRELMSGTIVKDLK